jgi:hypothetical protein
VITKKWNASGVNVTYGGTGIVPASRLSSSDEPVAAS